MRREPSLAVGGVVGGEDGPDVLERQLQLAQPRDRPGGLELSAPVAAVARELVDVRRPEDVELVVMTERADAQPGEPGEPTDRQQVIVHVAIVNPRAGRESRPRWGRRQEQRLLA